MQNRFAQLCRAVDIDAPVIRLTFRAHYVPAAHRAALGHMERLVPARMVLVFHHLYDLRDYIAAALHLYPVADLDPEAFDLVHVVQRGPAHSRSADWNRLEMSDRSQLSRPSHLRNNVLDLRHGRACGVLVCDSPTGCLASKTELLLQRQPVHHNDDAIDLVRQAVAFLLPFLDERPNFLEIPGQLPPRIYLEPEMFEGVQRVPV